MLESVFPLAYLGIRAEKLLSARSQPLSLEQIALMAPSSNAGLSTAQIIKTINMHLALSYQGVLQKKTDFIQRVSPLA